MAFSIPLTSLRSQNLAENHKAKVAKVQRAKNAESQLWSKSITCHASTLFQTVQDWSQVEIRRNLTERKRISKSLIIGSSSTLDRKILALSICRKLGTTSL